MKVSTESGAYIEVHSLKLIWMKVRLIFSREAKESMNVAVASLLQVEHLQKLDRILEKAEEHRALIREVVAGQPEIVVLETTQQEFDEAVVNDVHYMQTDLRNEDEPATTLKGMETVEWNPDVNPLDELYDGLERRIEEETAAVGQLLKDEKYKKEIGSC